MRVLNRFKLCIFGWGCLAILKSATTCNLAKPNQHFHTIEQVAVGTVALKPNGQSGLPWCRANNSVRRLSSTLNHVSVYFETRLHSKETKLLANLKFRTARHRMHGTFHRFVSALPVLVHNLAEKSVQKACCNTFLTYNVQFGSGVSMDYSCTYTTLITQTLLTTKTYSNFR